MIHIQGQSYAVTAEKPLFHSSQSKAPANESVQRSVSPRSLQRIHPVLTTDLKWRDLINSFWVLRITMRVRRRKSPSSRVIHLHSALTQFETMRSKHTLLLCRVNIFRIRQQSLWPAGRWPNTSNVHAVLRCILMRHTELQRADQGSNRTQSQALRQKHYRFEVKCSSTSLWDSDSKPGCNALPAAQRKYCVLLVKALFYCLTEDKWQILDVISVWELIPSQFSLPWVVIAVGEVIRSMLF